MHIPRASSACVSQDASRDFVHHVPGRILNQGLLTVADFTDEQGTWRENVHVEPARQFDGKSPADVLARVAEFRVQLDKLRRQYGLARTLCVDIADGATITPSVGFLSSGKVLNSLAEFIAKHAPKDFLVSTFYQNHGMSNKSPNEDFAQYDLDVRRLNVINTMLGM